VRYALCKGVISTVPGSVWFGSVRNRSDFDASGSVNRKRVYGSVRGRSEPSLRAGSLCGSIWRNMFVCEGLGRKITVINM